MVNRKLCKNGHERFTKNGFSRGIKQIYKCVRCNGTSFYPILTKFISCKKNSQGKKNIAGILHQMTMADDKIATTLDISITSARNYYQEGNINPDNDKHCKYPKVILITKNNLSELYENVLKKNSRILHLDLNGEDVPTIYISNPADFAILNELR